jgi:hypothetical protein
MRLFATKKTIVYFATLMGKGKTMYITVTPAYGRDYKTAKAAKADWKAGKDFIINAFGHPYDGKPISIRDKTGDKINIRFCRNTKICNT